jgi:hypothetical protein
MSTESTSVFYYRINKNTRLVVIHMLLFVPMINIPSLLLSSGFDPAVM